jgi:hypothetical protein
MAGAFGHGFEDAWKFKIIPGVRGDVVLVIIVLKYQ